MPTPLPPVTLRLDPAYPPLWRDAGTVQFGVEGAARAQIPAAWAERLIGELRRGIRASAFDLVAHSVGAPREEARALLRAVQPVLRSEPLPRTPVWVESTGVSDARTEMRMREALIEAGIALTDIGDRTGIGVFIVHGAAAALHAARYLREDVAHLPVAFDAGGASIGPLVRPGLDPCLSCRDGHDRDRDPAWPLLHAQLIARGAPPVPAARAAEAAGLVARIVLGQDRGMVRIGADGRRVWRSVRFHAECRCRELSSRSPQGIATVSVLPVRRPATRTATAYARPA